MNLGTSSKVDFVVVLVLVGLQLTVIAMQFKLVITPVAVIPDPRADRSLRFSGLRKVNGLYLHPSRSRRQDHAVKITPALCLPCAHGPSRAASLMLPSLCERSERADNKLDKLFARRCQARCREAATYFQRYFIEFECENKPQCQATCSSSKA